jgi:spore coat polysaccharide biosynthesis protein SpsF
MRSVVAFLQARMGSTRLPGKALLRIQGQSLLERAIRRLRCAQVVDEVAVLTTILSEDDAIVDEARRLGALVHRGSVNDVLGRFQEASEKFSPDIIIRATGDNPLIDIGSIDRIVYALRSGNLEWVMESDLPYGAATEAITSETLAAVHLKATDPSHREHVTLYIKDHREEFRTAILAPPESLRYPQLRITIDTPEDFAFMEALIQKLPDGSTPFPLEEYLDLATGMSRIQSAGNVCLNTKSG